MAGTRTPVVMVVIAGPQASGKSTLATALTGALRRDGGSVALVALDQIAEMALPTLPSWAAAHRIFESVTGQWLRTDLTCVIAEGSGSRDEVAQLRLQAPDAAVTVVAAITAPFAVALTRARRDSSRGASREYGFLSEVYERWSAEIALVQADVVIDTNEHSVEQCVELLRSAIESARADSTSSR